MTETASAVVLDGHALDGVELRVVDGEMQVRGPMLLRCYRDGTDPRTADGWLPTDDAGELAPDGRLTVHGRRGDLIVTGGENVWPAPVERILAEAPSVAEVAVVGRPDPTWGHAVTAVVVPADRDPPPLPRRAARLASRPSCPRTAPPTAWSSSTRSPGPSSGRCGGGPSAPAEDPVASAASTGVARCRSDHHWRTTP